MSPNSYRRQSGPWPLETVRPLPLPQSVIPAAAARAGRCVGGDSVTESLRPAARPGGGGPNKSSDDHYDHYSASAEAVSDFRGGGH
eukprot:116105-Hanusia_phi.AAC.1